MDRSQKADLVAELKTVFSETGLVVVTRNLGLSVAQSSELRTKMRDAFQEECLLLPHDLGRDADDRLLPLVKRLHQPIGAGHATASTTTKYASSRL